LGRRADRVERKTDLFRFWLGRPMGRPPSLRHSLGCADHSCPPDVVPAAYRRGVGTADTLHRLLMLASSMARSMAAIAHSFSMRSSMHSAIASRATARGSALIVGSPRPMWRRTATDRHAANRSLRSMVGLGMVWAYGRDQGSGWIRSTLSAEVTCSSA